MTAANSHADLLWIGQRPVSKRDQILACAQHVFAEGGFHQTEVQAISDQAGISKATIYKIFRSKDNLLLEMVTEVLNHLGGLVLQAIASPEPPIQRLRNSAKAFLQFAADNQALCQVILRDGGEHLREIGEAYEQAMNRFQPAVEPLFTAARAEGLFRSLDTRTVIETVLSCLLGQFQAWLLLHNGRGDLIEPGMRTVDFVIAGMSQGK